MRNDLNQCTRLLFLFLTVGIIVSGLPAQTNFYTSRDFKTAVDRGTRTPTGEPGAGYWQNKGVYEMDVLVHPGQGLVTGQARIRYTNNSPEALSRLNLKLFQNAHLPRADRAGWVDEDFLTDGLFVDEIKAGGQDLKWNNESVHRSPDPTNAWLYLPAPLPAGATTELEIRWHYTLQRSVSNHREGKVDSTALFCAYWYPRIAVYDDISDWDRIPLNNQIEFYHDYNDYDVTIRVPENFIVWATGELQNAAEVLNPTYLERMERAAATDEIIPIITGKDLARSGITRRGDRLAWRFRARNVPDFAFGVSDHFLWDATSILADSTAGRRTLIQTAYLPTSTDFPEVARIAWECIQYFSTRKPGVPYPYPTLSIFNGHGQMEYPMMVNDNEMNNLDDTKALTAHEIAHTYFPFYVGTNESAFAWMDEGWATLFEYFACTELYTLERPEQAIYPGYYLRRYLANEAPEMEVPIFTPSHQLSSPAYGLNAYGKSAAAYLSLQYLLGPDLFQNCLKAYMTRWAGKHPYPYDFFNTFSGVSGQDLDWFWQRWFMTYNTMDLALTGYRREGQTVYAKIRNAGGKPLPIVLDIILADGQTQRYTFGPAVWKDRNEVEAAMAGVGSAVEIRLIWKDFVDVNKENDRLLIRE